MTACRGCTIPLSREPPQASAISAPLWHPREPMRRTSATIRAPSTMGILAEPQRERAHAHMRSTCTLFFALMDHCTAVWYRYLGTAVLMLDKSRLEQAHTMHAPSMHPSTWMHAHPVHSWIRHPSSVTVCARCTGLCICSAGAGCTSRAIRQPSPPTASAFFHECSSHSGITMIHPLRHHGTRTCPGSHTVHASHRPYTAACIQCTHGSDRSLRVAQEYLPMARRSAHGIWWGGGLWPPSLA